MEKRRKVEKFSVPRDIIFEILKELSVKSLLRLRCVSKLWCSIIDDPVFVHSHHTRSHTRRPSGISLLFRSGSNRLYSTDPEVDSAHHILNIPTKYCGFTQHVNGLILMDDWICNPSTRECIVIPPPRMTIPTFELQLVGCSSLQFYPKYFLGFDPSSMKYKVLSRCYITTSKRGSNKVDGRIEYKILTLGTNSWRDIIDDSIPHQSNELVSETSSCCIAGVIYSINSLGRYGRKNILLAFEVGHEKFRVMSLPDGNNYHYFLLPVGEHLALIDGRLTSIWILEDYDKQLWKRQSLRIMYKGKLLRDGVRPVIPLGTIHTDEILFVKHKTRKLFYYDLQSKSSRILNLCDKDPPYLCTKLVESIFRLKGIEGGEHISI